MEYTFKRISEELLTDFLNLYENVKNERADFAFYKKKFNTLESGCQYIGYLAYDPKGMPVAYYGVFPTILNNKNSICLAAQSGDTMTHPEHRKKGLFEKLFHLTAELAKENKIEFFFGFPNSNSIRGFIKFGWKIRSKTIMLKKNIKLPLWIKLYKKLFSSNLNKKLLLFLETKSVNEFPKVLGEFDENCYFQNRSIHFLNYKSSPSNHIIKLDETFFWIKQQGDTLLIGDLGFTSSTHGRMKNIESLIKAFKKLGFKNYIFYCDEQNEKKEIFKNFDSYPCDLPLIIYNLSEKEKFENFYLNYTFVDFDTF